MGVDHLEVRKYSATDREIVRFICCETGHLGDPIDPYFSDREVFADLVTSYYTDVEPSWIYLLEERGDVVGYLTGCPDSLAYGRAIKRIWAAVAAKALVRGVPLRFSTARLAWRSLAETILERPAFGYYGKEYPAHFHIDLLPTARGKGGGRMLVEAYLHDLERAGVKGVFVETSCENERAVSFFRAMGFEPIHAGRSPGARLADGGRIHVLAMARRL